MALLRRQSLNFEIFDDQGPVMANSFTGNWTQYTAEGFQNGTITATPTPGASLSFSFTGSQAWLYGGLLNYTSADGEITSYPTADYQINGASSGSQKPWLDDASGAVVYFKTPELADGTHTIDIKVVEANWTNQYILDFFLITPTAGGSVSGVSTSRSVPSPSSTSSLPLVTTKSTPVGAIVGGVVGGIAGIAILAIALWYFLRKRTRGGQAYYFDKPTPADILAGEDHVEPFNATATTPAPSSAGFSGPGPQSAYSDGSSNQPLMFGQRAVSSLPSQYSQPGSEGARLNYRVSGTTANPSTGKAALMAQQHQNVQPPVQFEDSGIRFNENGEQEAGPSQLPNEVPPTYTPQ